MGLWLSILFGAGSYPLFWWSGEILSLAGQRPEVAALAQDFLRIAGLGMIPALLVMTMKSHLAALGRTQVVLWATLAAVGGERGRQLGADLRPLGVPRAWGGGARPSPRSWRRC